MTSFTGAVLDTDAPTDLAALRTSARGWHGVQLAVLGFIGLCGALKDPGAGAGPAWLDQLAGLLVLAALGLACTATVLVATAAWPVYGSARSLTSPEEEVHRTGRHLREGIVLTFLAVVVLAIATSSSWWPADRAAGDQVLLSTAGGTVCGTLLESEAGTVTVETSGQRFVVPVGEVVTLHPAGSCPSG